MSWQSANYDSPKVAHHRNTRSICTQLVSDVEELETGLSAICAMMEDTTAILKPYRI